MTVELISIGRANLDLYAQDVGVPFVDVTGFDAMVGGSPTNIAIGCSRLGLRTAVVTGVGEDLVGDFVVRRLLDEGVATDHIVRVPGKLTSLALLGVEPPDTFPLVFYREDPADIHVSVDDVEGVPVERAGAVQVSANALSRGPCAEATRDLLRRASTADTPVFMDLDLRPTEWMDAGDYGRAVRHALVHVDVVIGTEEEFHAALSDDPRSTMGGEHVPDRELADLEERIAALLSLGPSAVITKRGPDGATVRTHDETSQVDGFEVDIVNTVGAGDAFASGLITSRLRGAGWDDAVRFANACGAILVTRHGCSSAMPTTEEVESFLVDHRGAT